MASYFTDIYSGVSTVLEGMWITFKHLFEPTITIQYPREKLEMYPRTRASLVNDIEDCGYCLSCQKVCPVHIFTIKGVKMEPGDPERTMPDGKPKKMNVVQFDIDMSKCLYCGLCVEACDTKSLHWEHPPKEIVFDRAELYHEFSAYTHEQRDSMLAKEEARKAAAAAARAAGAAPGAPKPVATTPKITSEDSTSSTGQEA